MKMAEVVGEIQVVDFETHVSILEESEVISKQSACSAWVYKVSHPEKGALILFVTTGGEAAHVVV